MDNTLPADQVAFLSRKLAEAGQLTEASTPAFGTVDSFVIAVDNLARAAKGNDCRAEQHAKLVLMALLVHREGNIKNWLREDIARQIWSRPRAVRAKSGRFKREAIQRLLDELYPDGIPDQTALPNKGLVTKVAKVLEFPTSPDTILRAARRK